ncbi:MAG: MogA/MoaB family molybdenum cofactor biosynthesis protein [Anaerolineae bacterium]|nr:MogA/MoaB family molybdenum cofactor biosynthesis protein [Anaerolineae bacterium]
MPDPIRVAVLTSSDRAAAGIYADKSGPALQTLVRRTLPAKIVATAILPDDHAKIAAQLCVWADGGEIDLILITGGTGFTPSDVTPEATREVIEKEAPGLAEAMRAASLRITPHAMLSRAVCGIRGLTLIVNLPGSPIAACENLQVIIPALPHAIALLRGDPPGAVGHAHTA